MESLCCLRLLSPGQRESGRRDDDERWTGGAQARLGTSGAPRGAGAEPGGRSGRRRCPGLAAAAPHRSRQGPRRGAGSFAAGGVHRLGDGAHPAQGPSRRVARQGRDRGVHVPQRTTATSRRRPASTSRRRHSRRTTASARRRRSGRPTRRAAAARRWCWTSATTPTSTSSPATCAPWATSSPKDEDGVWRGGADLVAQIDPTITPELQYVVLLADQRPGGQQRQRRLRSRGGAGGFGRQPVAGRQGRHRCALRPARTPGQRPAVVRRLRVRRPGHVACRLGRPGAGGTARPQGGWRHPAVRPGHGHGAGPDPARGRALRGRRAGAEEPAAAGAAGGRGGRRAWSFVLGLRSG